MRQLQTERRNYPRTVKKLPLTISYQQGIKVIATTQNISCSGVYCCVNKPLPLMSKVKIIILLPICNEKIKCSGVIVRSEPTILEQAETAYQNVAIYFTDISDKDKEKIAHYVSSPA